MNQCHEDKKGENTVIIYRWYNIYLEKLMNEQII